MKDEDVSDEDLVTLCLAGNMQLSRTLVKRYEDPIYNFVYNFVKDVDQAADIVQDTFIKMWQQLNKFDLNKKFKSWIFTIARNTTLDLLAKEHEALYCRSEQIDGETFDPLDHVSDANPLADEVFANREQTDHLKKMINAVPVAYQSVMELRYFDDYSFDVIAALLQIPRNTALTRHHRGIQAMKKMVQKKEEKNANHGH